MHSVVAFLETGESRNELSQDWLLFIFFLLAFLFQMALLTAGVLTWPEEIRLLVLMYQFLLLALLFWFRFLLAAGKEKPFVILNRLVTRCLPIKNQRPTPGHNKQFSATESANAKTLFIWRGSGFAPFVISIGIAPSPQDQRACLSAALGEPQNGECTSAPLLCLSVFFLCSLRKWRLCSSSFAAFVHQGDIR